MIGLSDADAATLAAVVSDVEKAKLALSAAHVAQVRALARAGHLAEKQAAGSDRRVRDHDMALRSIAAEVAGVLRLTDRSVQRQIGAARELVDDYPATLVAWEEGRISRGHVYVITETGAALPPEVRPAFEEAALARCEAETPGRVRGELEFLAQRLHPRSLTERHREGLADRGARIMPLRDGMSELRLVHSSVLIDAIHDRVTQQARGIIDTRAQLRDELRDAIAAGDESAADDLAVVTSDERSVDQVRADLIADMLLTAAPGADPTASGDGPGALGAIRATVQVVIPALSLLGDDAPADLVGHSPIDADTARRLAGSAPGDWERVLTDPVSGTVVAVDRYRPTADMRRWLRARDQHCRFPGCRMPAVRCEVDHTHDHAQGGPTDLRNLAHLCQRHHSMKQFTAWRVRQLPGGILEWTSPLGRTSLDEPPAVGVHFVPAGYDEAPPPF